MRDTVDQTKNINLITAPTLFPNPAKTGGAILFIELGSFVLCQAVPVDCFESNYHAVRVWIGLLQKNLFRSCFFRKQF